LTPHAIVELEAEEEDGGLDGMEWVTIVVGVCANDCAGGVIEGMVGYVEEWVGVQWEEVGGKR
jgi:pre-rRNA-processing protein TSR4